jgi:hypothetical protein
MLEILACIAMGLNRKGPMARDPFAAKRIAIVTQRRETDPDLQRF